MRTIVLQPGQEIRIETELGALEILSTPREDPGFMLVKIPNCQSEDYTTEFVKVAALRELGLDPVKGGISK